MIVFFFFFIDTLQLTVPANHYQQVGPAPSLDDPKQQLVLFQLPGFLNVYLARTCLVESYEQSTSLGESMSEDFNF